MLTTKVVSNKKPPLLSDRESGGSTSPKIIDQVKPEDLKAAGITLTKEQKKNMKENKKQRR